MHSILVAPGDRGGERGRGNVEFGEKNNMSSGIALKDCTEDELVFSSGGRLFHRTGGCVLK